MRPSNCFKGLFDVVTAVHLEGQFKTAEAELVEAQAHLKDDVGLLFAEFINGGAFHVHYSM